MMKLPININDILTAGVIEWERLEFKAGWNPVKVMRTMTAFANDFQARHEEEMELMTLAANIPFDDRMNHRADLKDLDLGLIRSYLQQVDSDLFDDAAKMDFSQLCRQMNIIDGPDEVIYPKNVGMMFFNDHPCDFFPQTQIDVVHFPDGPGADTFSEMIFKGPLHIMLKNALTHIKSMVIEEKVVKYPDRPEASRFFNYPFAAIEESLCNAVYHRSYEIREPIEVRILPDRVSILSFPGPDRSISDHNIREFHFLSRRYRNRRVGEFLKELDMTEGRGTGIPKILRALQDNGSPLPKLVTDNDRTYFLSEFPIHSAFTQQSTSENFGKLRDTSEKKFNQTLMLLKEQPTLTISQLAEKLNISSRAVEMQIRYLKKEGFLIRIGSRRKGQWEVTQGAR